MTSFLDRYRKALYQYMGDVGGNPACMFVSKNLLDDFEANSLPSLFLTNARVVEGGGVEIMGIRVRTVLEPDIISAGHTL
jgi:hypothetical protein